MARDSSTARRLGTRVRIHVALRYTHTRARMYIYICRYVFRGASHPPTPLLRRFGGYIAHLSPSRCRHLISHEPGASSASPRWAQRGLGAAAGISISGSVPGAPQPPKALTAQLHTSANRLRSRPVGFTPGEPTAGFNPLFIAYMQKTVTPRCRRHPI